MTRTLRVVAGAVRHQGRVLAALRPPDAARGDLWELPGGKVEAGEDDRAALARELDEELGLTVEVGPHLAEAVHDYGDVRILLVAYGCTWRDGDLDVREHAAVRWLGPDDLDAVAWAPADVPLLPATRQWLTTG